MKKVFGKLASLCLTTTLLVGLMAGCGASGGKGSSAGENTSGSEQATSAKLEGANPGGSDGQVLQLNQAMPTGDMGKISKVNDMEKYTQEDVEKVDRAIRAYTPSVSDGLLINNAEHFHYYESLTSPVKEFYEAMQMVAEDPVSADYYINVKLPNPITEEEFQKAYFMAYQALCFDHPEFFWLYNYSKASILCGSEDFQSIYFSIPESYKTFEQDMNAFNQAVDQFLAQIDANASDLEKTRQIHDKLCELVTYDYKVLEMGNDPAAYSDLAHSAYGVLVENSRGDKNTAVCDGYSLAFQYLLTQSGIEAVLIPGKAGTSTSDMGGHAWNVVKLDGQWYEIDSTWDDNMTELKDSLKPDTEGYDYFLEALTDQEYTEILSHYLFGLTTTQIKDYVPGEADYYVTKDGKYKLCLTGESKHYRANEFTDMGGDSDLAGLAPDATGSLK